MINIEIQNPANFDNIPSQNDLHAWIQAALPNSKRNKAHSLVIRVVGMEEGRELNHTYRQKKGEEEKATNILSFSADLDDFGILELQELAEQEKYLGDLVLCEPVVRKEAKSQSKELQNHWAHLIIHGTLHLQGYDHIDEDDAQLMEALEVDILKKLGFKNPYEVVVK